METAPLKKFAPAARTLLIEQVTARLTRVLAEDSPARRESAPAVKALEKAIVGTSRDQVIEQVAYTWFNRFTALRFMDANGYTTVGTVSPAPGQTAPEILAQAKTGVVDAPREAERIAGLLEGRTPSGDAEGEAYRLLLVAECERWHGVMPYLFGRIDEYAILLMPGDLLSPDSILARMRAVMTEDACSDVEIIGWLYQFYIAEKKDAVFAGLKKNQKITAENIPAATQLFTPHWIVRYLVENSLGRLWLLNRPGSGLAARMEYYIAPEEPETDFLRIERPEDIRLCDPAAGSGHMLTYAFDLLHAIYEEEGYEAASIPALILTHNLTGVEIDDRAGALAAFALAMKAAASLGRRRFLRMEARPDIVVLEDVAFSEAEMQDVAAALGESLFTDALRETLGQFEQAKNFGSLIVPALTDPAETLRLVEARDFSDDLMLRDVLTRVVTVLRMAEALAPKYHVVVANPPYMGAGGMNSELQNFAKRAYRDSKFDLYTMFINRSINLSCINGHVAFVTIQNWMFLTTFEKFRIDLLEKCTIRNLVQIGYNSFPELNSKIVQAVATVVRNSSSNDLADYVNLNDAAQSANKKEILLLKIDTRNIYRKRQAIFANLPKSPIAYWLSAEMLSIFNQKKLSDVIFSKMGMRTGNNERFLRNWFEISSQNFGRGFSNRNSAKASNLRWFPYQKGGENRKWYGVQDLVVNWQNDGKEIKDLTRKNYPELGENLSWKITNEEFYFKEGGGWTALTSGKFSVRYYPAGFIIDTKGQCFYEKKEVSNIELIIGTVNSKLFERLISVSCPSLDFNSGPVGDTPFLKLEEKLEAQVAGKSQKLINLARTDWDAYETSWDFTTLPLLSPDHRGETLAATYGTLRGHWQSMTDEMQRLEEENNRIFIDAYGLQDELTPEVPLKEITLTCNPAYSIGGDKSGAEREAELAARTMREFLSYAVGCMFGRYSLDTPGLILANVGETLADYLARVPEPSFAPDDDNVIPVLDGDWFADDITERFRDFLRVTFGDAHFRDNLAYIEGALDMDIRKYFVKKFYDDHVRRYKKRPIYWLFASPKGSFQALVSMHRYRSDTVSVLLNGYLREYQRKLDTHHARLIEQSDDLDAPKGQQTKALREAEKVAKQIAELREWEREIVHPLAEARIEIDLDDGVKANYPKFGTALKTIPGLAAKE